MSIFCISMFQCYFNIYYDQMYALANTVIIIKKPTCYYRQFIYKNQTNIDIFNKPFDS